MINKYCLVVVPCHNEEARLDPPRFLSALEDERELGFVFVDDGSRDGTLDILRRMEASCPARIGVVVQARCGGKAEAVRQGVLFAFSRDPSWIGYWDADLATSLAHIADFAGILQTSSAQLVMGARVQMLGRAVVRSPLRHYLGRVFASLVSARIQLPVYDTQCGAKLFCANDVFRQAFAQPFRQRWTFDVELLMRLVERQARVGDIDVARDLVEFPLRSWREVPGSKIRPTHWFRILRESACIALWKPPRTK